MDAKQLAEIKTRPIDSLSADAPYNPDVWSLAADRDALIADLEKVFHRHRPVLFLGADGDVNVCAECDQLRRQVNEDAFPVLWPCPTVRDLDDDTTTEPREDTAA